MGRDFERGSHFEEEMRLKGITKVFLPFSWAETLSSSYALKKKKNEVEGNYKSLLAVFMGRDFERVSHAEEEIRLKGIN